jgi:diguanylate cyclase (GGDEF)-like protein
MKCAVIALAIYLECLQPASAAPPANLTTLQILRTMTNAEAAREPPVSFEATVIYYNRDLGLLDVQDSDAGIFVRPMPGPKLVPGDRILIRGTMEPSFLPFVKSQAISLLGRVPLPRPLPVGFADLVSTRVNCRLVVVHGVVHAADLLSSPTDAGGRLQLLIDGGYINLDVDSRDEAALKALLDNEVEAVGVAGRIYDGKMQQTGVIIRAGPLGNIKVLKRAGASPWTLPLTPMNEMIAGTYVRDLTQRIRVHGTITYYQPGAAVVLQDGIRSSWVLTQTSEPLRVGDVADATGFPDTRDRRLTLTHAEIRDSHVYQPISPQPAVWRQLAFWSRSAPGGHQFDLVSIEGQVVTEVREAARDEYVVLSDGRLFTAIYSHPRPPLPLPPMLQVPLGSRIRVTGICLITDTPFNEEAPFEIMLRTFDDLKIVGNPPVLNMRNLLILIGFLAAIAIAFAAWSWALERKLRRQTTATASLERRRSRILEDINRARPLAEIVEEIAEMVSFMLNGAPCCCQIADGARLGNCPPDFSAMRIVQEVIPARAGPPLGTVFLGFKPTSQPLPAEAEALSMGAELMTLAIESRRLYSDLRHRSEFDLLTDIHNRFSLEERLEAQIKRARENAGIFGLVYIDLDRFKQVNDIYGHHVGDLYLQQAALRMKQQLRSLDTLARLGGDEFAALVPVVRTPADVEEIARRLERSFDEPFCIEGHTLHGAASVGIALYPQDSATKDGLLKAADGVMYQAKNRKHKTTQDLHDAQTLSPSR